MSEENKGKEINESTLEGVSGGIAWDDLNKAKLLCVLCRRDAGGSCKGGSADLLANYINNVHDYRHCPYFGG